MKLKQLILISSLLISSLGWAGRDIGGRMPIGRIPGGKPNPITIPPLFPLPKPNPIYMGDGNGGVTVGGGNIYSNSCYKFLYAHVDSDISVSDRDEVLRKQNEISYNILSMGIMLERRDGYRPLLCNEEQALEIVNNVLTSMSDSNRAEFISACQPEEKLFYFSLVHKSHVEYLQQGAEYLAVTSDLIK